MTKVGTVDKITFTIVYENVRTGIMTPKQAMDYLQTWAALTTSEAVDYPTNTTAEGTPAQD